MLQVGDNLELENALGSGNSFPTGEFANEILVGLWPDTHESSWFNSAADQNSAAEVLLDASQRVEARSNALLDRNDGYWAESMHTMYLQTVRFLSDRSSSQRTASSVSHDCAGTLRRTRASLHSILLRTRSKVEALRKFVADLKAGVPPGPRHDEYIRRLDDALATKIEEVVDAARHAAKIAAHAGATEIEGLGAKLAAVPLPPKPCGGPEAPPSNYGAIRPMDWHGGRLPEHPPALPAPEPVPSRGPDLPIAPEEAKGNIINAAEPTNTSMRGQDELLSPAPVISDNV
ncbi:MAG: hypothetical protein QOH57_4899, partial [Mycobacterium sp.]|nr:hypothetical protein [Mycobacterium sp.]